MPGVFLRRNPIATPPLLARSRPAVRVGRIGVGVALVAVPDAIAVAVDTDPLAGAGRDAGEGHGPEPGEQAQRGVPDRRDGAVLFTSRRL